MSSDISRGGAPATRVPQQQRGRDRVAQLLAAATALFVEKGFDATTMTEVAGRAGASIGSLYLFFPTKPALAEALLSRLGDELSDRLDRLRPVLDGQHASDVAEAVFDALADFLRAHPVYPALIDVPGAHAWKAALRARRRAQVAALFSRVSPALPPGQAERLAVIVPQLMRITIAAGPDPGAEAAILDEMRLMLRRHLQA